MILRSATLIATCALWIGASAEIAPEITVVSEGYNIIAKLPCVGCPFLYQETLEWRDGPWKTRDDDNALLLNISLPFDSAHLSINNAALLSPSKILPRISANQILLDTSADDISKAIEMDQLDTLGHVNFGLSYRDSLRHLRDSSALVFHFDVFEAWTDLLDSGLTVKLDDAKQEVLEIVLLERPLQSAGDMSNAYEIVRAGLVPRSFTKSIAKVHTMRYHDWDDHGEKGTPSHLVSKALESFFDYIASGVWTLFIFILAFVALFVLLCLFCIFGCGLGKDEYESAQHGKRRGGGKGGWNDVERGKGRFLSAEELGLRVGGRIVGVGKAD